MLDRFSGAQRFEEWLLPSQRVYIVGEDHRKGPESGCSNCLPSNGCFTFMSFIKSFSRPINVYLELSYISDVAPIPDKNKPSLAVIPDAYRNGNISLFKDKYLECIFTFQSSTCPLKGIPNTVTTFASDLRQERKVNNKLYQTNEFTLFTYSWKTLLDSLKDHEDLVSPQKTLRKLGKHGDLATILSMVDDPVEGLFRFVVNGTKDRIPLSALFLAYEQSHQSPEQLRSIIRVIVGHYDNLEALPNSSTKGRQVLGKLQTFLQGQESMQASKLHQLVFLYVSSYGTAVTDLFIILQLLGRPKEDSIILTGSYHSGVYSDVFQQLGGRCIRRGVPQPTNDLCLTVEEQQ